MGGFDVFACLDGCGPQDFDCQQVCYDGQADSQPDPSACTEVEGVDCSFSSSSAGGGGSCEGTPGGAA